ncbi:MAG: carboxypeptidase-like regulatory domain-containing protein [Parabacteroides sp.]|nr:carboxypeptidase-like regulatory domain-containing protein [Parabacteroides sp.]
MKGTTNGTITDLDGKFILEGVAANSVLSVSYIGYIAQGITVGNKKLSMWF